LDLLSPRFVLISAFTHQVVRLKLGNRQQKGLYLAVSGYYLLT